MRPKASGEAQIVPKSGALAKVELETADFAIIVALLQEHPDPYAKVLAKKITEEVLRDRGETS